MKLFYQLAITFLLGTSTIIAQSEKDTIQAYQYYEKAFSFLTSSKADSSIVYFKKALSIYENAKAWERVAACYNGISENQWKNYFFDQSINNAQKAIEISNLHLNKSNLQEGNAYENIGEAHYGKSNYSKALKSYELALESRLKISPKNHTLIGKSYNNIGRVYFKYEDYNESLKYFKLCLNTLKKMPAVNDKKIASIYDNIGLIFYSKGEYEQALEYQKKSLAIYLNKIDQISPSLAKTYSNIANTYRALKLKNKSLEYLNKDLSIKLKIYGENHPALIPTYHNIGLSYQALKDYTKALEYFNKGLNLIIKKFGKNHEFTAHSYNNLGYLYEVLENYPKALEYYLKSKEVYKKSHKNNNASISNAYNYIGYAYYLNKEYKNAIEYFQKAIIANCKKENCSVLYDNFNPDLFYNSNLLLVLLEKKARALKQQYYKDKNPSNLNECIVLYQNASLIIDEIQNLIISKKDKLSFSKKAKEIFHGAIAAQMLKKELEINQNILKRSFFYTEKSKAKTLTELIFDGNAKNFSNISTSLLNLEKDLKINRASLLSKINKELQKKPVDSIKVSKYENQLFDINRKQDSLTTVLEKNYPKYYQLKYQDEVISVLEIQQKLDTNTTLLEFFTTDSITYAFTISKDAFAVKEIPTPKLKEQVQEFRNSITKNVDEFKSNSYQLYQKVMAPIADQLAGNQLTIVPDGPLWHVNFDLLLTSTNESDNPTTWSYLLKDYAISYANSATLLFAKDQSKPQPQDTKELEECLAFSFSSKGNTTKARNINLATLRNSNIDLPGTRKEIKAIANLVDGQYFYGSEATEKNFKKYAGDYNVLHLALHGTVDNEKPENSKLYFTKTKDSTEDGFLYSHELFALDIPAELTVLSACNTGTGKLAKGEGIMSLGNAFQYAGTKSLLLTNWEVSDQTTPEIMKYFYTHLKKGKNKAQALQQAKLQYLASANEETNHPYYWGGFYLLGDTAPVQLSSANYLYWILGITILGILLFGVFWHKKRSN